MHISLFLCFPGHISTSVRYEKLINNIKPNVYKNKLHFISCQTAPGSLKDYILRENN